MNTRLFFAVGLMAMLVLGLVWKNALAELPNTNFLFAIEPKTAEEIERLSDKELTNAYLDLLVELEASTTFSRTAGFNPQDYTKYKRLLRYRVDLLQEITRRDLPVPQTGAVRPDDGRERARK